MTAVLIPTRTDLSAYTMRVDLSDVEFELDFRYNQREGFWYLSVADQLGDPIVSGIKITVGIPLLRGCVDLRRPIGELIAIDTSNTHTEAGLEDLGDRVQLIYSD